MSHFYEGDIELDPELEGYVKSGGVLRTAMRERKRLWTSRIIPYRIPLFMSMYTCTISRSSLLIVYVLGNRVLSSTPLSGFWYGFPTEQGGLNIKLEHSLKLKYH